MFDHTDVDGTNDGALGPSSEPLSAKRIEVVTDTDSDTGMATFETALRLALRATDADVTCLIVRGRIVYWASNRRTYQSVDTDHAALISEVDHPSTTVRGSSVLSRWISKANSIRVPVNKKRGIYLVASKRVSSPKFQRHHVIALQDASQIVVSLIDRIRAKFLTRTLSAATCHARIGMILVTPEGHVVYTNEAAQRFIERDTGIGITDNKIIGRCCGGNATIRDCLAMIEDAGAIAVENDSGAPIPVSAVRIDQGGRPAIALFVEDPEKPVPPAEWLQTVYQMTRREAQVSSLLAGGQNVSEVATALGLSEATVKSYCKDVFAKLDVRRKPDLVRTLSSGPLTFAAPRLAPSASLSAGTAAVIDPGFVTTPS